MLCGRQLLRAYYLIVGVAFSVSHTHTQPLDILDLQHVSY